MSRRNRSALPGGTSSRAPERGRGRNPAAPPATAPAAAGPSGPDQKSEYEEGPLAGLQALAGRGLVQAAAALLALAFFVGNAAVAARTNTPTPDEFVYVPSGLYHLATGDLTFDPTNPPLFKMAMALPLVAMDLKLDLDPRRRDNRQGWGPWVLGTSFLDSNRERYLDAFFAARLVVVAFGVLLGALLFVRARELLSPLAALAVLALYATMPPLLAHASVATLDMGVTTLLFAVLLAASRFAAAETLGWAAATGALFGLSFAVKGTTVLFAPLVPLLVALGWKRWSGKGVQRFVAGGAVMAISAWAAILAAYGFSGFPLPSPFIEGIRFQVAAGSAGEFPAFLNGAWSQKGWWYYYLEALALKVPLATLLLLLAGAVSLLRARARSVAEAWLLLPPLLLIYFLSFHYAKDYGIRYVLPAFPFLILLAGRGVDLLLGAGRAARMAAAVLLVWQTASCALAAPHHLAYFNELAGGSDHARRYLLDSNLDWGQDLGRLKDYLESRGVKNVCLGYFGHVDPHLYGIDYTLAPVAPAPGLCAVSANFLAGYPYAITYAGERVLGVKAGAWSWFDRMEPVARVGRSIYVFDVTADDVARLAGRGAAAQGSHP